MRPRSVRRSILSLTLVCAAAACTSDELTTDPPAAVDVSGAWSGPWEQDPLDPDAPFAGSVSLSFTQGALGAVGGVVIFEGFPCLGTHPFSGTVNGQTLTGEVGDPGVRVAFFVDASKSMVETETRLSGSFTVELGTAVEDEPCSGVVSEFTAFKQAPAPGSPASAPAPVVGAPWLVPYGAGDALAWPVQQPGAAPRLWLQPLDGE